MPTKPSARESNEIGTKGTLNTRIYRVVAPFPATTRQHGDAGRAYSSLRLSDGAKKWELGGVQRKIMRNRISGSSPIFPAAAAQPITHGMVPAAPPVTMF
jgi:hypothetical protein